jgi:hypothetical protein
MNLLQKKEAFLLIKLSVMLSLSDSLNPRCEVMILIQRVSL